MSRREGPLGLTIFASLFSVYLLTFSGAYHSSDELSMLVVTDSLARRGALEIDLLRWMGEQQGTLGPDGHLYSRKGIGTSLAAFPLYWLAQQSDRLGNVQTAMLTNAVVTALTAVVIYRLLGRLGYRRGISCGVAWAYGLGTMAWPYARYLFSEPLAGLGLVLCAYGVVSLAAQAEGSEQGSAWYPLLAGQGLCVALLARLNNTVVAPFLGLYLLVYLGQRYGRNWRGWIKPLFLFGLPVLAALAVTAWYNWFRFGSLWKTGYLPQEAFAAPFLEGFYGLTFSPGKGLFWYNPLLFAAVAGMPAFYRRHRNVALLVVAIVLIHVVFYASWYLWWGGHGWGPRFLVPVLPFAILPLAPVLEAARRRRQAAVVLGLVAALSLVVQLEGVAVSFNVYLEEIHAQLGLYHPATLFGVAYSPLLRQVQYIHWSTLDLAWARGGSLDGPALAAEVGLSLISALALAMVWRGRLATTVRIALVPLLVAGAAILLLRGRPEGDVANVARALAEMERAGEVVALAEPLMTEAFQDAYDGHLPMWGVASREEIPREMEAVWVTGTAGGEPAAARFQVGSVRLDLQLPAGQVFDGARLPFAPRAGGARLGHCLSLEALQLDVTAVQRGEVVPLVLYWRTLCDDYSETTPIAESYTVFVHAIDELGAKGGQVDALPCRGDCPTSTWRPGDLVGEWYGLRLRADAQPGRYELVAGMYDLANGERLPVLDSQEVPAGDTIWLGSVEVQP